MHGVKNGWQVGQCLGGGDKQKRGGVGVDGGLNLPGLQPANACTRATVVVADIDDGGTSQPNRMVIAVAVGAGHQDAVGHGPGIGQGRHAVDIPARQTCCRGQGQTGGSA